MEATSGELLYESSPPVLLVLEVTPSAYIWEQQGPTWQVSIYTGWKRVHWQSSPVLVLTPQMQPIMLDRQGSPPDCPSANTFISGSRARESRIVL